MQGLQAVGRRLPAMHEAQIGFEPRWKEELVCRTPWAVFVVELTMGKLHVYFPDEATWKKSTPPRLHDRWAGIARELGRWCRGQNIPLSIVPDAWIHLESEPPANLS